MADIQPLKARYHEYIQFNKELFAKAKFTDGLFGMGDDPKRDPGHTKFFDDVALLVEELLAQSPTPQEAEEAVGWMLEADSLTEMNSTASWMMIAAQQHAEKLIPLLSPDAAARIHQDYSKRYPKLMRLPIQNQLVKSLKARSKG